MIHAQEDRFFSQYSVTIKSHLSARIFGSYGFFFCLMMLFGELWLFLLSDDAVCNPTVFNPWREALFL